MKVVIPAAGIGTRLRPYTYTLPKALLPVGGKPIIGHIIDGVSSFAEEIVVIVGYFGEKVVGYVKAHSAVPCSFVEQEERLGLGHAVYMAREKVGSAPMLVILGDTVFDVDFAEFVNTSEHTIGVKEVEDPSRFGIASVDDQGVVKALVEKPEEFVGNLAIVGLYYFTSGEPIFSALQELVDKDIRTKGEYQLTDAMSLMLERGERIKVKHIGGWYDCGKPETLLETNRFLLERVGSNVEIGEDVVVIPPVFVGRDVEVRRSVIGPYVSLGDGVKINGCVLRDVIVQEGAHLRDVVLDWTIVGREALVEGQPKSTDIGDSSVVRL